MEGSTIIVEMDENDYLEGSLLAARWTRKRWAVICISAAVYLGIGLLCIFYAPHDFFILGCAFIGAVFGAFCSGLFGRLVLFPKRLKSRFAERKALRRKTRLSWGEEGLTVENENGHSLVPWSDFFKFRENDRVVLLYTSRATYLLIPKRFFKESDQLHGFMTVVNGRIGVT